METVEQVPEPEYPVFHMFTIPEAAKVLGMDERTLEYHIEKGDIRTVPVGARKIRRIPSYALLLWQFGEMYRIPKMLDGMLKQFHVEVEPLNRQLKPMKQVRKAV